jgi:hypothetical protein
MRVRLRTVVPHAADAKVGTDLNDVRGCAVAK